MVQLTRIKVITGYAAHARFNAELGDTLGEIERQIREPYRYSPTHTVIDWNGTPVVLAETKHRRYEVFRVDGTYAAIPCGTCGEKDHTSLSCPNRFGPQSGTVVPGAPDGV